MIAKERHILNEHARNVNRWQKLYRDEPEEQPADRLLATVLADFAEFGEEYLDYFFNPRDEEIEQALATNKITRQRLQARALNALQDYWDVVGRVAEQRQVTHYREILDDGTSRAKDFLEKLPFELPNVLICFDNVWKIRHAPFTDTPFISTPYFYVADDDPAERDWYAIPHELGHYVYWNLGFRQVDGERQWTIGNLADVRRLQDVLQSDVTELLTQKLPDDLTPEQKDLLQALILAWLEEIFADVVGTHLGDAGFAESLQTVILNRAGTFKELAEDDGNHPPLIIRPFIRNRILNPEAAELTGNWHAFFKDNFGLDDVAAQVLKLGERIPDEEVEDLSADLIHLELTVAQVNQAVLPVVDYLHQQLKTVLSNYPANTNDGLTRFTRLRLLAQEKREATKKKIQAAKQSAREAASEVVVDVRNEVEDVYETLLQPRILERGYQHTHNLYGYHLGIRRLHFYDYTHYH
ncbi:hypothetical protein [Candidatus Leptofilum sp.]|uniref:hypothetical protein n=1 Tax=Candidatus Leptofilum sp. TaxID=3241576 RepID=UPI003B5BF78A